MMLSSSCISSSRLAGNGPAGAFCRDARATQRRVQCQAVDVTTDSAKPKEETPAMSVPEWVPEQGKTALGFLNSTEFDITTWGPYKEFIGKYMNDPAYQQLIGWKSIPELINGRLSMLGFTGALFAELFSGSSVLKQLAGSPQPVLLVSLLVVAASCIPAIKGVKGDYVEALKDTYTVPEGVFTESMERVHGRLAMVGLSSLILIELVSGRALL